MDMLILHHWESPMAAELRQLRDSMLINPSPTGAIRMTPARREGLDALQREYDAFRESTIKTLALINSQRLASK